MARTATRTVTVRKRAESASIELRAGETTLGVLRGVAGTVGDSATITGKFTHAPAYVDFTERFLALATALRDGDAPRVEGERASLEAAGVHVYHAQHEMRIDRPATVQTDGGEVRFTPNDAYLMLRTGGL
jgi:hypothetical protein